MSVLIRLIIISIFLCAIPKRSKSLDIPVQIGNLSENEVMELLMLCDKFIDLKMTSVTIYTVTNKNQVPLLSGTDDMIYQGTARIVDYEVAVENNTLLEIWSNAKFQDERFEVSLRVINVVESVGVFLLIKTSILAGHMVSLTQTPPMMLTTVLPSLDKIDSKFYQLNIPRTPVDDLRGIIQLHSTLSALTSQTKAKFQKAFTKFIDNYSNLIGFVDIGDVHCSLTNFNPNTNTMEEFLNGQLEFIQNNVDKYFNS